MAAELPFFDEVSFERRLAAAVGFELEIGTAARLYRHYLELRRWNPRLSLIGPGTAGEIFTRHYAESLAALPLLGAAQDGALVDLGSGAGFPGLVLAAARPDLPVVLVEARERKWSFLQSAVRQAGLRNTRVVLGRIDASSKLLGELAREFGPLDVLTSRAVALDGEMLAAIARDAPGLRVLLWETGGPRAAPGWFQAREQKLASALSRRIMEYRPLGESAKEK